MTRMVSMMFVFSFLIARSAFADAASEAKACAQAFAGAVHAADSAGVLALYADSATVIWPGEANEAKGKAAIERLVKESLRRRSHAHARDAFKRLDAVSLSDKYIADVEYWDVSVTTPDGKVATLPVHRTAVLIKGGDGKWRYFIDHMSVAQDDVAKVMSMISAQQPKDSHEPTKTPPSPPSVASKPTQPGPSQEPAKATPPEKAKQ